MPRAPTQRHGQSHRGLTFLSCSRQIEIIDSIASVEPGVRVRVGGTSRRNTVRVSAGRTRRLASALGGSCPVRGPARSVALRFPARSRRGRRRTSGALRWAASAGRRWSLTWRILCSLCRHRHRLHSLERSGPVCEVAFLPRSTRRGHVLSEFVLTHSSVHEGFSCCWRRRPSNAMRMRWRASCTSARVEARGLQLRLHRRAGRRWHGRTGPAGVPRGRHRNCTQHPDNESWGMTTPPRAPGTASADPSGQDSQCLCTACIGW
jgi:hypothetical protein